MEQNGEDAALKGNLASLILGRLDEGFTKLELIITIIIFFLNPAGWDREDDVKRKGG